jgi:hypothetical protein
MDIHENVEGAHDQAGDENPAQETEQLVGQVALLVGAVLFEPGDQCYDLKNAFRPPKNGKGLAFFYSEY